MYDSNQALFLKDKGKYLSVLTNLAYISIKTKNEESSEIYFRELDSLEKAFSKSVDLTVRYFSSCKSLKLFKFIENGYSSCEEQELQNIVEGLELYADIINPVRKAYLYYQLGTFYLANNDLKLALNYLNKVLNDKQNLMKEDIYSFAQILQLIVHFELKNHKVLPYILTNTKRFLKGKNRLYKFEMIFLKMIGKIRNESISSIELEDILIEFLPEIEALKQDKFERIAFEYFDFGAWLGSKIERKTYLEVKKASA
jgi:tetratricopeptide (TPR) repeat protein